MFNECLRKNTKKNELFLVTYKAFILKSHEL